MKKAVLQLFLDRIDTPIGELVLAADQDGNLRAVDWTDYDPRMFRLLERYYGKGGFTLEPKQNPGGLSEKIRLYFEGDLTVIDDLPVQTTGTPFQREVWCALREIPHGTTLSYAKLAERIGRPAAVRAVGLANGSNPVGVIVPCHRVIGANGSLTGYGGGMERKRWLLQHEAGNAPSNQEQPSLFKNSVSQPSTERNHKDEPQRLTRLLSLNQRDQGPANAGPLNLTLDFSDSSSDSGLFF